MRPLNYSLSLLPKRPLRSVALAGSLPSPELDDRTTSAQSPQRVSKESRVLSLSHGEHDWGTGEPGRLIGGPQWTVGGGVAGLPGGPRGRGKRGHREPRGEWLPPRVPHSRRGPPTVAGRPCAPRRGS